MTAFCTASSQTRISRQFQDTHRNGTAGSLDAPNEGNVIGTGWNIFSQVFYGGGGILYGIEANGELRWYQDTHRDGSAGSFGAANEGNVIATGWNAFSNVLSTGNGMIYAIDTDGELRWFQDTHRNGTAGSFAAPNEGNVILGDWTPSSISQIVSGGILGGGIIYVIEDGWSIAGVQSTALEVLPGTWQEQHDRFGTSAVAIRSVAAGIFPPLKDIVRQ